MVALLFRDGREVRVHFEIEQAYSGETSVGLMDLNSNFVGLFPKKLIEMNDTCTHCTVGRK